ncbi:MAG: hypothetical protein IKL71_00670 [Bacteroidaceae bacterium]|nr:hypothetical protein [Bacteroidaceae bacterium]
MTSSNTDITSVQHQRLRDSLRLAQSRQQNIEESLKRLRSLQEKLYRHQQLNSDLDINSRELFLLNKEFASISDEATEMDRFETFESIMAPFLRMQMLEAEAEENRRTGMELEQQIRQTSNRIEELRKEFTNSRDNINTAEAQHQELCAIVEECSQHDGACAVIQEQIKRHGDALAKMEDRKNAIDNDIAAQASAIADLDRRLENLNSTMHTLESHEAMLERADLILGMLHRLDELSQNLKQKNILYNRNAEEQRRAGEELARIIAQNTDIEQQIQTLQDESEIHRTNIRGMQSYDVQERVMKLKSRLLMLAAAQSLWRRISSGYASIEEKTQLINSLRLEIEQDLKTEQELTVSVAMLKRLATDKEYSLNMSKSQSLISLRADLKEGTACSVCGATHHPYHSDTMQDQYKLISDFRSDYEAISGELQGQEKQLAALHDKLTQNLGQQIAEQKNLEAVRLRQSEDVKEWRVFAQLDPTFHDCSASTDSDARMATIRQLLDNAQRDLQGAEAELGEFNYHTTQITNLSGKIAQLEGKKMEISLRTNEAQALCRILAAEGNRLEDSRKLAQDKYHNHYELLQKDVTIPEWFKQWQHNAETLYLDIRQMAHDWKLVGREIAETRKALSEANTKREMLVVMLDRCMQSIEYLKEELRLLRGKHEELHERRQLLLPHMSTGEALDRSLKVSGNARAEHARCAETLQETVLEQKEHEGAYNHARKAGDILDQKASAQRNLVDLWIRAYNANHPPVQYNELNAVLTQDIDWNEKRRRIRENRMATSLQQQKVKALQAEIIALEVDTGTLSNSQLTEKQITTETQIEEQEASLREVLMQIARLKIELGL